MSTKNHSIIRWAGSKRASIGKLSNFWHDGFNQYIEPFAGSCALFFALTPNRAILGDLNFEIINALKQIRYRPRVIHQEVSSIPGTEAYYYNIRSDDPNDLSPSERAVRFMYLNRHCFNGIYRTNKSGEFNVPFASSRAGHIPPEADFIRCGKALRNAKLIHGDYLECTSLAKIGDFVYLDPPYAVTNRRMFREYHASGFCPDDLDQLEEELIRLDSIGANFVLTYADCTFSRRLAKLWNAHQLRVRRNVAGFTGSRKVATERIITNIELDHAKRT